MGGSGSGSDIVAAVSELKDSKELVGHVLLPPVSPSHRTCVGADHSGRFMKMYRIKLPVHHSDL